LAVVEINADRQAGQVDGVSTTAAGREATSGRGSNGRTGLSIHLPHDLAFGDFHLRRDCGLLGARHARRAATSELQGAKTGQNCELERGELSGTLYHANHPFVMGYPVRRGLLPATAVIAVVVEASGERAGQDLVAMQPSQQGFGEGLAWLA
jgi:hypothetical protein